MKRIKAEEVVAAFKETGLQPHQGAYIEGDNCACGLGALYAQSHIKEGYKVDELLAEQANDPGCLEYDIEKHMNKEYGHAYVTGFVLGFDQPDGSLTIDDAETLAGFEDGSSAFKATKMEAI